MENNNFNFQDKQLLIKYKRQLINTKKLKIIERVLTLLGISILLIPLITLATKQNAVEYTPPQEELKINVYETIVGYVTGYNTVPEQTDETPCYAGNRYICGRTDVIACPRKYELYTEFEIYNKKYICLDRTHEKYDNRFDISCDKDMECPYKITGYTLIKILKKHE